MNLERKRAHPTEKLSTHLRNIEEEKKLEKKNKNKN